MDLPADFEEEMIRRAVRRAKAEVLTESLHDQGIPLDEARKISWSLIDAEEDFDKKHISVVDEEYWETTEVDWGYRTAPTQKVIEEEPKKPSFFQRTYTLLQEIFWRIFR